MQNCHLGLNFLDELLDTITMAENIHDSSRVWITTEVHPKFPISLLQVLAKYSEEISLQWINILNGLSLVLGCMSVRLMNLETFSMKHQEHTDSCYLRQYKERSKQQSEGNASRLKQISSAVYNSTLASLHT